MSTFLEKIMGDIESGKIKKLEFDDSFHFECRRCNHCCRHDDRVIASRNGAHCQPAHAGPCKDGLDDGRATQQEWQTHAVDRDDGDHRVSEGVLYDHSPFAEPTCPCPPAPNTPTPIGAAPLFQLLSSNSGMYHLSMPLGRATARDRLLTRG